MMRKKAAKVGRPPVIATRRLRNPVTTNLSDEELESWTETLAGRSRSEVLRELVLASLGREPRAQRKPRS